jgi:hypothetical protein
MLFQILMILALSPLHAASGPTCIEREISKLLGAHETLNVTLSEGYFNGIGENSFQTCLELRKGDIVNIYDEAFQRGVRMFKIRDPHNEVYMYFPREALAYISDTRMQVKANYFKHIHKSVLKKCFTIRKGQIYKATGLYRMKGQIMVEIQDPKSWLYQWIPTKLVSVRDSRVVQACGK